MNFQSCQVDAERLIDYLQNPSADAELPEHVANCTYCQVRLLQIGASANMSGAQRKACRHYQPQLPDFIIATTQKPMPEQFAALEEHLVICEECFALYQEILSLEANIVNDSLPIPPRHAYKKPDLSFLKPEFEWITTRLQRESAKMIRTVRLNLAVLFQQIPLTPSPSRQPQPEDTEKSKTKEVAIGVEKLGELDVTLKLFKDMGDPLVVHLEVHAVAIRRFEAGFAGTQVVLRFSDNEELVRNTDANGVVMFEKLPGHRLDTAILEITPAI